MQLMPQIVSDCFIFLDILKCEYFFDLKLI